MCSAHSQVIEGQGKVREGLCLGQGQHLGIVVVRIEVLIREVFLEEATEWCVLEGYAQKDYVICLRSHS